MESEEVRWKGDMVQRSGREEKHGTDTKAWNKWRK